MEMQNLKTFKSHVQRDLLFQIIKNMRKEKLGTSEAQALAKDFLPLLESNSIEEMLSSLALLSKSYKEVAEVFATYALEYEKTIIPQKLEEMSKRIAQNDIEGALSIAKGGKN